tara:strand:- start:197 stop:457 length:261 start_codon:yes stop_codon:yes gene_type:complete
MLHPQPFLVFTSVLVACDLTICITPMRWVFIGVEPATGHASFLPFMDDAGTVRRRVLYCHSYPPLFVLVVTLFYRVIAKFNHEMKA